MSETKPEITEHTENSFITEERKRWGLFGLPFTFTLYRFNEETLTVQRGLLTIRLNNIPLHRIMDTSYRCSPLQKLFKIGSVRVASTDQTLPELVIKNIHNAESFKALLDEQVERERLRVDALNGEAASDAEATNDI